MQSTRREILASTVTGAAFLATPLSARADTPTAPGMTFVFSVRVFVAAPIEHGMIDGKRKRFIPITGGSVSGPKLSGVVLSGGGDWQAIHQDGLTEVFARYSLWAEDGAVIGVTNTGVRVAEPAIIKRLAAGENVDPSLYYFRTAPVFEVVDGPHAWLRRHLFVARGIRRPDHVMIDVFQVD